MKTKSHFPKFAVSAGLLFFILAGRMADRIEITSIGMGLFLFTVAICVAIEGDAS